MQAYYSTEAKIIKIMENGVIMSAASSKDLKTNLDSKVTNRVEKLVHSDRIRDHINDDVKEC